MNEVREDENVVDLEDFKAKLKTGGRVPPSGDWLTPMKIGSEFLVRPKTQQSWLLAKFMQAGVKNGNVLLIPMRGEAADTPETEWIWVDPIEFCKWWEFRGYVLVPVDD